MFTNHSNTEASVCQDRAYVNIISFTFHIVFVVCEDRLRSCKTSKRLIFHRLLLTIPSTFPDYKLVQINLTGKHVVGIFSIINGHRAGRRGRWWIIAQFSLYIRRSSWIDCSGTVYPGWSGSHLRHCPLITGIQITKCINVSPYSMRNKAVAYLFIIVYLFKDGKGVIDSQALLNF